MKNLRYVICLFAVSLFTATTAFSQANVSTFEAPIGVFIECANDGAGEVAFGFVQIHLVERNGFFHANPQGGSITGLDTGIEYRATGVTTETVKDNGSFTFINRFHFVGKGTQFFVKETVHVTVNANGDVTAEVVNSETTCK